MKIDWTDDSEDLTIYIRLHPRDEQERRYIIDALEEGLGGKELHGTLYTEGQYGIHGVCNRTDGQVAIGPNGEPPCFELRAFRVDEEGK